MNSHTEELFDFAFISLRVLSDFFNVPELNWWKCDSTNIHIITFLKKEIIFLVAMDV